MTNQSRLVITNGIQTPGSLFVLGLASVSDTLGLFQHTVLFYQLNILLMIHSLFLQTTHRTRWACTKYITVGFKYESGNEAKVLAWSCSNTEYHVRHSQQHANILFVKNWLIQFEWCGSSGSFQTPEVAKFPWHMNAPQQVITQAVADILNTSTNTWILLFTQIWDCRPDVLLVLSMLSIGWGQLAKIKVSLEIKVISDEWMT